MSGPVCAGARLSSEKKKALNTGIMYFVIIKSTLLPVVKAMAAVPECILFWDSIRLGNADCLATCCLIYEPFGLPLLTHCISDLGKEGEKGEGEKLQKKGKEKDPATYISPKESFCTDSSSPPEYITSKQFLAPASFPSPSSPSAPQSPAGVSPSKQKKGRVYSFGVYFFIKAPGTYK